MVLVSYSLDNYVSILQTKLSNREGHEARRIGLEAMLLDEHIEGRHGEGQARLKRVFPAHYGERRTISEGYWNFCSLM